MFLLFLYRRFLFIIFRVLYFLTIFFFWFSFYFLFDWLLFLLFFFITIFSWPFHIISRLSYLLNIGLWLYFCFEFLLCFWFVSEITEWKSNLLSLLLTIVSWINIKILSFYSIIFCSTYILFEGALPVFLSTYDFFFCYPSP